MTKKKRQLQDKPYLGFGLGLRTEHYEYILNNLPPVDWFEIISENYMVPGGKPLYYLDKIRNHYPVVMHGVSMSLGSVDPLDKNYLKQLKELIQQIKPEWVSDHLCWTGVHGKNLHDLMPLPYTEDTVKHVVSKINQVQDYLGQQILLENVSSYVSYKQSEMTEWEFLTEIVNQADCFILLDINNIYVSAFNHNFNSHDYLYNIPKNRVYQHHLAGHTNNGNYIIDTHDHPVIDPVWSLYKDSVKHFGLVSTMIERDDNIPAFEELFAELIQAKKITNSVIHEAAAL